MEDMPGYDMRPECSEHVPRAQAAPPTPAPALPDFEKLGADRSFFRVTHVGEVADHFMLTFSCIEQSIAVYGVHADGTVVFESGGFGGIGVRSGAPREVPDDKRALVDQVRAQFAKDYTNAGEPSVQYLGTYREVMVEEIVPVTAPGDPYKRMAWDQHAVVPVDADLKSIVDRPGFDGGETLLCWKDVAVTDCGHAAWMDFTIAPTGAPQLVSLLYDGSPSTPEDRARFRDAMLAAARGAAPVTTDVLMKKQGGGVLPAGFSTTLRAGFSIRPQTGGTASELRVPLSSAQIAHGAARGRATATIDGTTFTLAIEAAPETPASGNAAKLRVHFRYELDDGRGHRVTGDVIDVVDLVIDGDAAAVWSLALDEEQNKHGAEPPVAQTIGALHADFGVAWNVEPWYPK